jgi:flagellar biosynthetic protein FliO
VELVDALARVLLVFGLLAAVLVGLKRWGGPAARRGTSMEVVASTRLGKGAAVTVVRVDGREWLLGVTDHAVTLLSPTGAPEGAPALGSAPELPAAGDSHDTRQPGDAAPAAAPRSAAAVLALVKHRLVATTHPARSEPADGRRVPPTTGEFLQHLWAAARKQPLETSELSPDAVATALAHATGAPSPVDAERPTGAPAPALTDLLPGPRRPDVADGTATTDLPRHRTARTDAQLDEEHPWSRACAPAFRSADRAPALR